MKQFGLNDWLTPLDIAKDGYIHDLGHYYSWLFKLSTSLFKWEGLPDSVSERYLELACQSYGRVLFCKPESMENFIVVSATESNLNVYGRGKLYNVASPVPIIPVQYTYQNSVMIYNDDFASSMIEPLSLYATRLADNEEVRRVNQAQLKTPTIIPMEESKRLSYNNLVKKVFGGAVHIFTGKNLDISNMKALDLGAKFYIDKMQEDKMKIWNESLTFLGIENNNNPKKERNIQTEIDSNNMQTLLSGDIRLKSRQDACDKINKMFPELNITVDYRRDVKEMIETVEKETMENANENE